MGVLQWATLTMNLDNLHDHFCGAKKGFNQGNLDFIHLEIPTAYYFAILQKSWAIKSVGLSIFFA